jgi:hypothetical protein
MSTEGQRRVQEEAKTRLAAWRTKLDELKVKGYLLKMEYRDKQGETVADVEKAYEAAKSKFDELTAAGGEEASKLGAGFSAAWDSFKSAYKGVTEESADA